GNPVNPLLGAKVLPGETDLALPGPLPFILSRTYSSYRTRTPAPVGVFGPGWKAPSDIRLQLRDDGLILNDNGGRSIHFEPLLPGEVDGRTQRYHYDLTGKLTQSEDEGLVILWYYDESDRITHRTVNGEPAEQWQYDGHGWLTDISHLSEGHRVAVHYGYDDKGRLTGECQTVENPETGELLWQHETKHAYNEQGLANRVTPDSLPPVEWLTYGSGYLAGMKLGGTPLVEYTRDRLHRETVRSFGSMAGSNAAYELTSTYTPAGQLQSQHLNSLVYDRDYGWSDNGDLVRISGPRQTREYGYSATGRLESVRTLAPDLDIR
ncbi:DUF6531 domain-containing protein, partial [Escherichia coli]|uniref:DUF6531 domain-containing protein n=1 Tax=Escherichia coli TaxID=562 RepID=UPI00216A964E